MNATVLLEPGLWGMVVAKEGNGGGGGLDLGHRLKLAEHSLKAALGVMSIRARYFRDVTDQGVEIAPPEEFSRRAGAWPRLLCLLALGPRGARFEVGD